MLTFDSYHTHLATHLAMLRTACTTEAIIGTGDEGVSCFFMVAGSGRGTAGLVPASETFGAAAPLLMADLDATAEAATVEETVMGGLPDRLDKAINKQIAASIITALDGCATALLVQDVSSPLDMVAKSLTALGENEVPVEDEDQMFALGTPALRNRVLQEPLSSGAGMVTIGGHQFFHWAGLNWLFHPALRGAGTTQEQCYVFHRHALGHALDLVALAAPGAVTGGIDPKTGRGWMKAKTKHLATVLQPTGIVRLIHDGTRVGA